MSKYTDTKRIKRMLEEGLGDKVVFNKRWNQTFKPSQWAKGKPFGLITHHTAGAATDSNVSGAKGNRKGDNDGQIKFVENHPDFNSPASQFTLDRDGTVYCNCLLPTYHAGKSDPNNWKGSIWQKDSGCGTDAGNSYYMGVECVSKGQKKDFTPEMKESLGRPINVLADIFDWDDLELAHLNHKTYAGPRKVDTKYTDDAIHGWVQKYGTSLWQTVGGGLIPEYDAVKKAEEEGSANPAAWRLALKLSDLGFYKGEVQPKGQQMYPKKAVANYNAVHAPNMESPETYGPKMHQRVWGE